MVNIAHSSFDELTFSSVQDRYHANGGSLSLIGAFIRRAVVITRRNVKLMLAIILAFMIAASIFTMLQKPDFTARSTIEISNRAERVLGDELEPSDEEFMRGQDDLLFLNTQVNVLNSRSLAERVALRLNLQESPRFFQAMQAGPPERFASDSIRQDAVIDLLLRNSSTSLAARTRIAELGFTSSDPDLSAEIVNAYVQEFIQLNLQRRQESSAYARSFVEAQLEEARDRLETSEIELNSYARQSGLVRSRDANGESGPSNSITTASMLQLNQAANQARANRLLVEADWAEERGQPLLSSPAALQSPAFQQLLVRQGELEGQLGGAGAIFQEEYPSVMRLQGELNAVKAAVQRAATGARNAVRSKYLSALATERRLRAEVQELERAKLEEQQRNVRYNTLAREADTNRSIYDGLLQRHREISAASGSATSNISIIDRAVPPRFPSSPIWSFNLALALSLGALFAGAIAYIKEDIDDRVRLPEDVEGKLGLDLLGVIPTVGDRAPLIELADPKSVVAEAYGALRSTLNFANRDGPPRLVLLTSSRASEGKSTSSYALALGMAQTGKKTLLVDADLRRPSIHNKAGVSNTYGLSNLLAGDAPLDDLTKTTRDPNLYLLTSGPLPSNPAELLESQRTEELFKFLKDKFDTIIVDSPPILGLADAPNLSALVDGVLMVVEADVGRRRQIRASIRRLRLVNSRILGVVLTKFDPEKAGNRYSSYSSYDYYSYRNQEAAA